MSPFATPGSLTTRAARLLAVLLVVGFVCAAWAAAQAASSTAASGAAVVRDAGELRADLERLRIQHRAPGLAVAVFAADGDVFVFTSGVRDVRTREPVTPRTVFALGSVTKTLTATLLAQLEEQGVLGLDDLVVRHVDEFAPVGYAADGEPTLADLLAHRTGIGRLPPHDLLCAADREDLATRLGRAASGAPPRGTFRYSSAQYAVLGLVTERATGRDYGALLAERLLEPLGMGSAGWLGAGGLQHPEAASGHQVEFGPWGARMATTSFPFPDPVAPAGGLTASLDDVVRWVRFQIGEGSRVEGPRVGSAALRRLREPGPAVEGRADLAAGRTRATSELAGLGWFVVEQAGLELLEHAGGVPGFSAAVGFAPERGTGFVVLANVSEEDSLVVAAVRERIVDEWTARRHATGAWVPPFTGRARQLATDPGADAGEAVSTDVPPSGRLAVYDLTVDALRGNLLGDPVERRVSVYLPPSYDEDPARRFPVVYLLHGVGDTDARWRADRRAWFNVASILDLAVGRGEIGEMIVVMPSCRSSLLGGMYTDSPVHGGLATFVTEELVTHVDATYRTLASPSHRGVGGHSMGGYAALMFGMTRSDVFGHVYAMNAACVGWHSDFGHENLAFDWIAHLERFEDLETTNFWNVALLSAAHAFSPAPDEPPFYAHLPFHWDGTVPHLVPLEPFHSQWERHLPLYAVEDAGVQRSLRTLGSLRFDTALVDEFTHIPPTNRALSERLAELGIEHTFEMYTGDHRAQLPGEGGRLHTEFFPFFSRQFGAPRLSEH